MLNNMTNIETYNGHTVSRTSGRIAIEKQKYSQSSEFLANFETRASQFMRFGGIFEFELLQFSFAFPMF